MGYPFIRKIVFSILFFTFSIFCVHSQNAKSDNIEANNAKLCSFSLELKGAEYDKLQLIIFGGNGEVNVVDGKKTDIHHWEFIYPDSIYQTHSYMQLFIPTGEKKTLHTAALHLLSQKGDTIRIDGFHVSPRQEIIASKYYEYFRKNYDFYGGKDVTFDEFIVSEEKVTDFSLGYTSFFLSIDKEDTLKYEADLNRFITLVKENNNSHFLLTRLKANLLDFKAKGDIALVYAPFSDEIKNSTFGKHIKQFLDVKQFSNMSLPDYQTGVNKPIVANKGKYTIVSFSASWCTPCHKLIPLLKNIYADLSPMVDLVYISIDEVNTLKWWEEMMVRESIPWRSLLAANNLHEVKTRYNVEFIPLAYLVYPDETFEIIDIRKEVDRKKLYELCGRSIAD